MTKKHPIHRPPPAPISSGDLKLMGLEPEPAEIEAPRVEAAQTTDPPRKGEEGAAAPRGRGRRPSGEPTRVPLGVRCLPSYQTRLEKLWNRWRSKDRTLQKGQVVEQALEMLFKNEGV